MCGGKDRRNVHALHVRLGACAELHPALRYLDARGRVFVLSFSPFAAILGEKCSFGETNSRERVILFHRKGSPSEPPFSAVDTFELNGAVCSTSCELAGRVPPVLVSRKILGGTTGHSSRPVFHQKTYNTRQSKTGGTTSALLACLFHQSKPSPIQGCEVKPSAVHQRPCLASSVQRPTLAPAKQQKDPGSSRVGGPYVHSPTCPCVF